MRIKFNTRHTIFPGDGFNCTRTRRQLYASCVNRIAAQFCFHFQGVSEREREFAFFPILISMHFTLKEKCFTSETFLSDTILCSDFSRNFLAPTLHLRPA